MDLADRLGKRRIPFARQRVTLLAPQIVEALLDGWEPKEISINRLLEGNIQANIPGFVAIKSKLLTTINW